MRISLFILLLFIALEVNTNSVLAEDLETLKNTPACKISNLNRCSTSIQPSCNLQPKTCNIKRIEYDVDYSKKVINTNRDDTEVNSVREDTKHTITITENKKELMIINQTITTTIEKKLK